MSNHADLVQDKPPFTGTPGRRSVKGLCTPPLGTVRVAFVGLGDRGQTALRLMANVPAARITALCDVSAEQVQAARSLLATDAGVQCFSGTAAYRQLCCSSEVDLVYVCSDWASHTAIAVEAMRHGKHVAVEVPAATTLEKLWQLVDTAEETRRHCVLLENCCYDPQLPATLASIRSGQIGQLVHAEGSYYHCLNDRWTRWRLDINRRQRGDLYPTHELGPICQALEVGSSDRLQTLICMDSSAFAGPETYQRHIGETAPDFQNGDHTTTLVRTALGRTILLKHDVLTRQPYERRLTFIGTHDALTLDDQGRPSHEEMTRRMNARLIECLAKGLPTDTDVYDLATWCAVIPLSRLSIERGFAPVQFPNFMRG